MKEYAEQGYTYAVSLDLSKYFDTLNPVSYTHLDVYKRQDGLQTVDMSLYIDTLAGFAASDVCKDAKIFVIAKGRRRQMAVSYTHLEEELKRMEEFRKAQPEVEQKKEKPMSQKMFKVV